MIDDIKFLDDATRPVAPTIEGVTPTQRHHGRRLALFHKYHLQEMARVRKALDTFLEDQNTFTEFETAINSMKMIENYRTFGNLCGQECQALTLHHTVEDRSIFPQLRNRTPGLEAVIDRLSAEHEIVHELLVRLESASREIAFDPSPASFTGLREIFDALERVVMSHFGYEEVQLEEALGFYDVPL